MTTGRINQVTTVTHTDATPTVKMGGKAHFADGVGGRSGIAIPIHPACGVWTRHREECFPLAVGLRDRPSGRGGGSTLPQSWCRGGLGERGLAHPVVGKSRTPCPTARLIARSAVPSSQRGPRLTDDTAAQALPDVGRTLPRLLGKASQTDVTPPKGDGYMTGQAS